MQEQQPPPNQTRRGIPGFSLASVRGRILAAFGLLLLTLATIVGGATWLSRETTRLDEQEDAHREIATALTRARLDGTTYVATILFYMATGDKVLLLPAGGYHNLAEESGVRASRLLLAEGNEAGAQEVDEMAADLQSISATFDQAIAERRDGDADLAGQTMLSTVPQLLELESKFERLARAERRLAADLEARSDEVGALAFWLLVASGGVGGVLGFGVAMLIAASILRPLSALESAALAVAAGNLDARAPETGPREFSRLGASLNRMTEAVLDASKRKQLEAEREQARQALQQRLEQLQGIYRLTDALARAEDVDAIYRDALNCLETTLGADRSAVLLFDAEGVMRFKASQGLSEDYRRAAEGHSPWSPADKTPKPVLIEDVTADPSLNGLLDTIRNEGIAALAFFPLLNQSVLLGKLMLYYDEPHYFSDDQVQLAQAIASHVAFALHRRGSEERIRQLAFHDELTGLPNRLLFRDRLSQALAQARRNERGLALASLDLDRFKTINDTLGHSTGDALLGAVASRLLSVLRASDTVARVGGDEFLIVLPGISQERDAGRIAQKIVKALRRPFAIDDRDVRCTASLGVTIYPSDAEDEETLRRNADIAMYRAKEAGRDNYQMYAEAMGREASWRLSADSSLRTALEQGQFELYYQPIAKTNSGTIVGAEALIRWNHPEHGLVLPGEFISLAEETGLIAPLSEWVLQTACRQGRKWMESGLGPLRVAVNISAHQFLQQDMAAVVTRILKESRFDPNLLELEITESAALRNAELTQDVLRRLVDMGIRISIDDFGTGYSSLTYLKQFPIQAVKIDRSFVRDLVTDQNDAVIATAIINMAHILDLNVVAEGVETQDQLDFIKDKGCDEFQGYLLAKPMPASALTTMLCKGKPIEPATKQRNGARPAAAGRGR